MPLDPGFVADCPYGPDALLIDDVLSIDRAASAIVARMPTTELLPITRDQRTHPVRHPRHVSGGLMIHATGIMGFAHAYFVLELRHADGWIGYGTHIHDGRFRKLARVGEPLRLRCTATMVRKIRGAIVARYQFEFRQADEVVYEGDQTAMFTRVAADGVGV
jgi:3-hydroxymyristoyl/3-hydroxydecanoyl-(acyl carrier protein) dehydratase